MSESRYSIYESLRRWRNSDYIWMLVLTWGYSRFEFLRSASYSLATSIVVLFLSKVDSLEWVSWACVAAAIVLAFLSALNFTSIAITLKEAREQHSKLGTDLHLPDFLRTETKNSSAQLAKNYRRGMLMLALALVVVLGSFLLNKYFNSNKNARSHREILNSEKAVQSDVQHLSVEVDSLSKELRSLGDELRTMSARVDSSRTPCK